MKKELIALLALMLLTRPALAEGELKQTFSDDNRLTQEEYLDDEGRLCMGEKGFARHVLIYDDGGRVVREHGGRHGRGLGRHGA